MTQLPYPAARLNGRTGGWLGLLALIALVPVLSAQSDDGRVDKSKYTLCNPVAAGLLREMSTDRPDQTESAYTVDAGHVQLEMDFVTYVHDNDGDARARQWTTAPINLKVGVLNNVDVQFVLDGYVHSRITHPSTGVVEKASGLGDVTTRVKINLWGNDGGNTALAIMPFVKWPLSSSSIRNGKTEGGIMLPLAVELSPEWGLGAMTEVDFVHDGQEGYDTEYINTITVGRPITDKLGFYVEFVAVTSDAPGFKWQGQADLGFTYALAENTRLDFGCNFGVTDSAPDYNPFVGLSKRF